MSKNEKYIIKFGKDGYVGNNWLNDDDGHIELVTDIEDAFVFGNEVLERNIYYLGTDVGFEMIPATDMPDIDLLVRL